ncbi:MAG: hypothetical protein FWB96_08110 [Defluviitaleaceae bacterium]|nr:hypothetical protein [Defluviitaleaceae bacterium]MCL2224914.1 hypothetical protein [Defluviitaleaceae bacterium]MCL2262524.1 hypothetical protein [Defluviitaleaceae bacterium]
MVQFLAGMKGEGKTKKLIDMSNQDAKVTDGNLVFIDDNRRHLHDLHRDVRYVVAESGELANYREFIGFVLGILAMNSDIRHIYVDSLNNILAQDIVADDCLEKLKNRLDSLVKTNQVGFTISLNCDKASLPEGIKSSLL